MSTQPQFADPRRFHARAVREPSVEVSAVAALDTSGVDAVADLVHADGDLPGDLGTDLDRAALTAAGFDAYPGSSIVVPRGGEPLLVLVGAGPAGGLDRTALRDAAAAAARATSRAGGRLGIRVPSTDLPAADAGQVATEGALLARYRFTRPACGAPRKPLTQLVLALDGADPDAVARGVAHRRSDQPGGSRRARPGQQRRPPTSRHPPWRTSRAEPGRAVRLRGRVVRQGPAHRARLRRPARRQRRQHRGAAHGQAALPARRRADRAPRAGRQGHHVRLRRHQLKPSDPMHLLMKMDMGGAAAVLGAFTALRDLGYDDRGHRLADVHRQHALGLRVQARRRAHRPRRHAPSRSRTPTPRAGWR